MLALTCKNLNARSHQCRCRCRHQRLHLTGGLKEEVGELSLAKPLLSEATAKNQYYSGASPALDLWIRFLKCRPYCTVSTCCPAPVTNSPTLMQRQHSAWEAWVL